mmetsp:Transcript_58377/g.161467  ORF Transcript_58377/g.161467 Transcript_58377/m.161467 type:complete len:208 (-) Transcript_58377:605-1228(-)
MQCGEVPVGQRELVELVGLHPRITVGVVTQQEPGATDEVVDDQQGAHEFHDFEDHQCPVRMGAVLNLLDRLHELLQAQHPDCPEDAQEADGFAHAQGRDDVLVDAHEDEGPVYADNNHVECEPRPYVPLRRLPPAQLQVAVHVVVAHEELRGQVREPEDGREQLHHLGERRLRRLEDLQRDGHNVPTDEHDAHHVPEDPWEGHGLHD